MKGISVSLSDCNGCLGKCCRGIEEKVKSPRSKDELTSVRWQLHFRSLSFFIRNGRWYRLISSDCIYLDSNSLCSIYEDRPEVCREYNPPDCERYYPIFDTHISTPEEFDKWLKKNR